MKKKRDSINKNLEEIRANEINNRVQQFSERIKMYEIERSAQGGKKEISLEIVEAITLLQIRKKEF